MKRIVLALMCLVMLAAAPPVAGESQKSLMLYGWLAGLQGTMGIGDAVTAPVEATFDDLSGFVDFAMAGHFEVKDSKRIFVTDIAYTGLSDERDATVANQPVTVNMDINQWIFEMGGGYRVKPEVDVLIVGRWYLFDLGGTSTSVAGTSTGESSQDWGDIYLGGRYSKIFKEKWMFSIRGDIGVGGSDFAWFGDALLGYRFNEKFSTSVAWRVLDLDREPDEDNYFLYDVTQAGLGIGLGFGF